MVVKCLIAYKCLYTLLHLTLGTTLCEVGTIIIPVYRGGSGDLVHRNYPESHNL